MFRVRLYFVMRTTLDEHIAHKRKQWINFSLMWLLVTYKKTIMQKLTGLLQFGMFFYLFIYVLILFGNERAEVVSDKLYKLKITLFTQIIYSNSYTVLLQSLERSPVFTAELGLRLGLGAVVGVGG